MREYEPSRSVRVRLEGSVFGKLTVVKLLGQHKRKNYWLCECSCGGTAEVRTGALRNGNTKSCGCSKVDRIKAINAAHITHGLSGTRTYKSWGNMMHRCYNKENVHFHRYGGRGIYVEEKFHDFGTFLAYMGECPPDLTLERVDNDVGYVTGNMVWATDYAQHRNKSSSIKVVVDGVEMIISDAARMYGLSVAKALGRYHKGLSIDEILKTPHNTKRRIELFGEPTSLYAISQASGVPYQRLWARINRQGLTVEEAVRRG